MNWKKWSLFLVLVLAMSTFLVACGGGNDSASNKEGKNVEDNNGKEKLAKEQVLNVNIATEPPSLHPGKATDTTSAAVLDQIFEGLTRVNQEGEVKKAMASDIKISDDKKTYTFTIREGATWSNGDPVTAQDFEYAWKWVLDPKSADTDFAYKFYRIKNAKEAKAGDVPLEKVGINAKDDNTLVVELNNPTPYFLQQTALFSFYPVNKEVAKKHKDWAQEAGKYYVTNGPFSLDKWEHKDEIVLKKNPNYWDADTVKLETINMLMVEDENTELQMYKSGELDWTGSPTGTIPLSAIPSLKQSGKLNISPLAGIYFYIFNTQKPPFDNVNIRKAFSMAINREAIVNNITKAEQIPAMAFVPPTVWEESKEGYFKDNNVEKAKKLLQKGLAEEGLEELPPVEISYNSSEAHAAIAQAIQDMWKKKLDVKVEMHNQEWNVYLDSLGQGDFHIGRLGWLGSINDASNFLNIFETDGGSNYSKWVDEKYAKLLEKSRTITDPAKRKKVLRNAEQILIDDMPIAPIYFYTNVWLNKDYVKNIEVSSLGGVQYKWGYIAEH